MAAVWLRARSQLRHHWPATVALALVIGLAGGVVLAAVAGARRTQAAFPAFVERSRGSELAMFAGDGQDRDAAARLRDWSEAQPHVRSAARSTAVILQIEDSGMPVGLRRHLGWLQLDPGFPMSGRPLVVDGKLPRQDAPLEVAIDEELAGRAHLRVGDALPVGLFTAAQFGPAGQAMPVVPAGPTPSLRVTAIVRQPFDLLPVHREQSNIYVDASDLYLSPAFWRRYGPDLSTYGYGVDVRFDSPSAAAAFKVAARRHVGDQGSFDSPGFGGGQPLIDAVHQTVSLQAKALLFFAALTALAALVLLGQTLGRQIRLESDDAAILRSVGFNSRSLVLTGVIRAAVIGVAGAALAAVTAVALSPLAPVGLARQTMLSHPVDVDGLVLAAGAPLVLLFVVAAAAVPSWRIGHPGSNGVARPSTVAAGLTAASAPPPITTGVELALRSGSGRAAVPVRTAIVAAVVSVVALVAAATYAFSADGVVSHPRRYGVTWDVSVGNYASSEPAARGARTLAHTPGVAGWSGLTTTGVTIEGHAVSAMFLRRDRGEVAPVITEGRLAISAQEVVLGRATAHDLHARIGDRLVAEGPNGAPGRATVTVVGIAVLNTAGVDRSITPGEGALFDWSIIPKSSRSRADAVAPQVYLVRFARGANRAATMHALERAFPSSTVRPLTPPDVDRLRQVAALPWLLGGMIGLLGAAATAHAVLSAVRRRRRELAVLKTIGFVRRQVSTTVAVQASTFALVAVAIGVPLGVITGRVAWRVVASSIGLDPVVVVPALAVVAVVAGALVAVNLLAAVPGVMARRIRPAVALRAE